MTVTPSYQLDGQPTTPDELTRSLSDRERRSGVLTVTYEIANVTSQTTTVSFDDAAGTRRTEVVTQAVPIAGALKLTLPKNASGIDAPGRVAHTGHVGSRSELDGVARAATCSRAAVHLLLDERDERSDPARQAVAGGHRARTPARPATRPLQLVQLLRRPRRRLRRGSRRRRPRRRRRWNRCKRTSSRSSRRSRAGGRGRTVRPRRTRTTARGRSRRRAVGPVADDLDHRDECSCRDRGCGRADSRCAGRRAGRGRRSLRSAVAHSGQARPPQGGDRGTRGPARAASRLKRPST